ncbi:GNAT family N-acetyltransferase [Pseudolactococcus plantarum]|uniref:GNAT family acetyltransferase n=1 Tax=Pseudolactococcus plantarum TaxID=1365 RepID=A0A2A5S0D2_9LACT|nr:GNAT family N-acetyltransferase [Lactococcus plantarum]PCS06939.1 GNAT family acetyltransferase [Lactococcus plantarum]HCN74675.1 GNAT family N-acetyltransferase [Lactococcus sp.]
MEIKETQDTASTTYKDALDIRRAVFVVEQQVPLDLEIDQYEADCTHFVLYTSEQLPVATLRTLVTKDDDDVLIQRVATLKNHRGNGYAASLVTAALAYLKTKNITCVELHAQLQAIPFYEKLGFQAFGSEFLDADISHMAMKKTI